MIAKRYFPEKKIESLLLSDDWCQLAVVYAPKRWLKINQWPLPPSPKLYKGMY